VLNASLCLKSYSNNQLNLLGLG